MYSATMVAFAVPDVLVFLKCFGPALSCKRETGYDGAHQLTTRGVWQDL
jgi:hypothetical protein